MSAEPPAATSAPLPPRRPSPVDTIAEAYVRDLCALDPLFATSAGIAGYDDRLPDFSPAGHQARAERAARALVELDKAVALDDGARQSSPQGLDDIDQVTVAAMRERLGLVAELRAAGEDESSLNVLASPVQEVRGIFDIMPSVTADDWDVIGSRLEQVAGCVEGYLESLHHAAEHGHRAARRQVEKVIAQCEDYGGPDGFFAAFAASGAAVLDPGGANRLAHAGAAAAESYRLLATALNDDFLASAPTDDAVGEQRYEIASRYFLGASIDQRDTYAWGLDELGRIEAEMAEVSRAICGQDEVSAAVEALDADSQYRIHGKEAFRDWMQERADRAITELDGTHFDIPEPVRRIECRIAPTSTGGIYYTPPSDDFSRPGAMWWSVPEGVEDFAAWQEVTTVHHEGVPGHHLQCGQAAYRSAELNSWRRLACWVSGHGEGWALYAERLMEELGFLEDPGARLGMLDSQAFRAARVVVDIGVHLRLAAPAEVGGGTWDAAKAWDFLCAHTRVERKMLAFELDRYLGWPGQAPSYKVGERIWHEIRADAHHHQGADFDLKHFHRRALDVGSVGLDVLREVLRADAG